MTIQPTTERVVREVGNRQRIYRFDNGFGASVVQGPYTYGGKDGLFELAVARFTGEGDDDWSITYDTDLTDDVLGHLSEDDVQETLGRIRDLPSTATTEESAR
jgi:hypothetical protein